MQRTALKTTLDFEGDELRLQTGNTVITLQWVRDGAYTVTVYTAGIRVDDLCGSYPTEDEARLVARGYAHLYLAETADQPALTGLNALAAIGTLRQVRPTMAHAHLADITDAQQLAIDTAALAADHTVRRGKAFPLPVLRALARKGLGTLNYEPGHARRKVVESLTLNSAGLKLAGTAVAA